MFQSRFRPATRAALILALFAAAPAANAADVALTGLSYDLGVMRLNLPRIEVKDTQLSETELRAILDPAVGGDGLLQRVEKLNAGSIVIPEMVLEQTFGQARQSIAYRDVTLSDVRAGVIAQLRVAATTGSFVDDKNEAMRFRIGEMTGSALDIPQGVRALTTSVPDPSQVAMRPVIGSLAYRDYVAELPRGQGQISVGRVESRGARARPGKEPLIDSLRGMMAVAERNAANPKKGEPPSKADMAVIARVFAVLDNFEYGVVDAERFEGRFKADGNDASMAIARMRYSDQPQQSGFALSGFRVAAGPAQMSLDEVEVRDFSFRDAARALVDILERGDVTAFMTEYPRLIPKLGTIRISGFSFQAPDTSTRGANEPIKASAKSLELGFGGQVDGVPTAIRFGAEGLAAPLPANSREQGVRDLLAMGYKDVNLSWLADIAWQQQRETLEVRALNLSGKDMLSAAISGQIGNVGKEAFSTDMALAQVAWLSATAQRVRLNLENLGLFEKLLANEARKARKTPDALRREWGTLAAIGLPAILGDSDGAKALTGAISRFLAKPGKLDIDIRSKSPAGLGLADAVAVMGAPQAIFDRVDITARAE